LYHHFAVGVATTLVRQGIPSVVAMQFEITDAAAITFAGEFYAALSEGFPVDAAVAEARKAIYAMPNDVEWGTPVLYMRSPDGVLFNLTPKPAAAQETPAVEKSAAKKMKKGDAPAKTKAGSAKTKVRQEPHPPLPERINKKDEAVMIYIPAGEFLMGTDPAEIDAVWKKFDWREEWKQYTTRESPMHRVRVDGFYMYQHEVTNRQFEKFVKETGHKTDAEKGGFGWVWNFQKGEWEQHAGADWRHPLGKDTNIVGKMEHPVVQVSWNDAKSYCKWAGVDLPTEAQWEYAARGGNTGLGGKPRHIFVWGDEYPKKKVANVADESFKRKYGNLVIFNGYDDGYAETSPVGIFEPNGFGLHDMAGNVWEWCEDWFDENYYANSPLANPLCLTAGTCRVVRGGSWLVYPFAVRVASRDRYAPAYRYGGVGIRCVAVADFR
jgi:formylglycine-generating enzyme required for sulfatase activity